MANDGGTLADGIEPYVTLQSLRAALPTDAWRDLLDRSSNLSKVLHSPQFKSKGHTEDQIDSNTVRMFALLHCVSKKPMPKAVALYNLLQDGGLEAHEQISATDKDIIPIFLKLCKLVTVDIFVLANQHGGVSQIYSDEEAN